ncbi:MAG: class I SAM-dependent methyltransferase [Cyanobacteria bacterium P01_C01_bin.120]
MSNSRNKNTYTARDIVNFYSKLTWLQPAETAVLRQLQPQLADMKMLDIGVGGGRTTLHFAPLTKQYMGIDYSPEMIAACQKRFKDSQHDISFQVGDARDLSQFADDSFDFILFSYNGIDYVSHEERLKILMAVKRVGKPGCYFCFSTHNLQTLERKLSWRGQLNINPIEIYVNLVQLGLFWLFNLPLISQAIMRPKIADLDYVIVRDDSHRYRLNTYYIRAAQQLEQLAQGFEQVEIYSWKSQEKVLNMDDSILEAELWLYYLCQVKPASGSRPAVCQPKGQTNDDFA